MNDRLTTSELSELIGCKPNQRMKMAEWLRKHNWIHEIDMKGIPIVMRAYRDRKLGIVEGDVASRYATQPNFHAFEVPRAKRKAVKQRNGNTVLTSNEQAGKLKG